MAARPDTRLFLDSNVIISGLYSPHGTPGKLLLMHAHSQITMVVSRLILEEVVRTIRAKIPAATLVLQVFLTNSPPEVVKNAPLEDVRRWTEFLHFEDAAVLASAIRAKPDYFVTGDKHFLSNTTLLSRSGLHIISPAQAVKLLKP